MFILSTKKIYIFRIDYNPQNVFRNVNILFFCSNKNNKTIRTKQCELLFMIGNRKMYNDVDLGPIFSLYVK